MPSRNVEARPLKWRITQDKRVNSLGDPWAMLAYTWMIPCADNLGRMEGDPDLVASMIFPRQRAEITPERMAEILQALHDAGLIFWYEVDGERFVQFPPESWERHQKIVGNMTRESEFPEPPKEAYQAWYEHVRTRSNGVQTRLPEGKGREGKEKGREDKGVDAPPAGDAPPALSPDDVAEIWNQVCGDVLPRCQKLTDKRRKHIRRRIAESPERQSPDWWRSYFARIRASPFCCGQGNRGWRATLDWAVRSEDVVVSVLEGKYDRKAPEVTRDDSQYEALFRR